MGLLMLFKKHAEENISLDSIKTFFESSEYKPRTKDNLKNFIFSRVNKLHFDPNIRGIIKDEIKKVYEIVREKNKKSKNRIEKTDKAVKENVDFIRREKVKTIIEHLKSKPSSNKFNTDPAGNKKLALIIKFLFLTGVRIDELTQIRKEETKLNGIALITIHGKGSKARHVKIERPFYEEIDRTFQGKEFLFETLKKTQYNTQNLNHKISKAGLDAIGIKTNPHMFRHSFAMDKKRQGVSIKAISQYLGHKSIQTTLEYYDHSEIEDSLLFEF